MTTETIPASAPETVPFEPTTPIKPSEAIRLGCLIAPVQAFTTTHKPGGRACAIGAMALGMGWDGASDDGFSRSAYVYAERHLAKPLRCPACTHLASNAEGFVTVYHLNDGHRWSRERIADWLEGLGL